MFEAAISECLFLYCAVAVLDICAQAFFRLPTINTLKCRTNPVGDFGADTVRVYAIFSINEVNMLKTKLNADRFSHCPK